MSGVMVMPWVVIEGTPRLPSPSAESRDRVALDPVNPRAALPGINGSPATYALGCSGTASTMSPGDAALAVATLDVLIPAGRKEVHHYVADVIVPLGLALGDGNEL